MLGLGLMRSINTTAPGIIPGARPHDMPRALLIKPHPHSHTSHGGPTGTGTTTDNAIEG